MEYRNLVIESLTLDYKQILFGSYTENTVWSEFLTCIEAIFKSYFEPKLKMLASINDYELSSREINVLNAVDLGFNFKNSLFTNEEYNRLLYVLRQYQKKKGTSYYLDIIGMVKSAHFDGYPLWTKNYKDFERENKFVLDSSIVKDYTLIVDNTGRRIDYGSIDKQFSKEVDYDYIYSNYLSEVDYGFIPEHIDQAKLPNVSDPTFYIDKYYPTSHVDLEYDFGKFPIDESDVKYLFYKVAPIQLVLNSLTGVYYCDPGYLYFLYNSQSFDQSVDTFPIWTGYEGTLYTKPFEFDTELYNARVSQKFFGESDIIDTSFYGRTQITPRYWNCYRSTEASWASKTGNGLFQLNTVDINTIRNIIGKGILLEDKATNLIPYSNVMEPKSILLEAGTYNFEALGNYGQVQLEGVYNGTVEVGHNVGFTTFGGWLNITPDESVQHLQLVNTPYPTSPIVTKSEASTRVTDNFITSSPYIIGSDLYFKFIKEIEDNRNFFLLGYGNSATDTVNLIRKNINGVHKLVVQQIIGVNVEETELGEFKAGQELGLIIRSADENKYKFTIYINKDPNHQQQSKIYELYFEESDWINGKIEIPVSRHLCGSTPILQYIQKRDTLFRNVFINYQLDEQGNVVVYANQPFRGRLLLTSVDRETIDVYECEVVTNRPANVLRVGSDWYSNNGFNGYLTYFLSV